MSRKVMLRTVAAPMLPIERPTPEASSRSKTMSRLSSFTAIASS